MLFEKLRRPMASIKQGTGHDQREMSLMNKMQQFSVSREVSGCS